jgi:hypothetical protein
MTGRNILLFNYSGDGSEGPEKQFNNALLSAENKFGLLSGEVGLILSSMIDYYRSDPSLAKAKAELIAEYEQRIEEIIAIYLADQKTP